MKQKMVINVSMHNEESRKKALTIVVGCSGVLSVALKGDDLRQIELTGEGVDVIKITRLLRKKVGHVELVSVGPLQADQKQEPKKEPVPPLPQCWARPDHYVVYDEGYCGPVCSIM